MRSITIIFIFLISFVNSSKCENIFVEILDDTVTIWNTGLWENCVFSLEFSTNISDSIITIIEHDTVTQQVTCTCAYDLSVKLTTLVSNDYTVKIYRQYSVEYLNPDSLYFIGEAHFQYTGTHVEKVTPQYYQSACYFPDAIKEQALIPDDMLLLSNYPNPFNSSTRIEFYLPTIESVTLKLFNISGRLIKNIVSEKLSNGYHFYDLDAEKLSSGLYIVTLETKKAVKSKKIILLK